MGPIFISHSSTDRDHANALGTALRLAFADRVRTFNTSSGTAIQAGNRWRLEILEAIRDAEIVILWASPSALDSKEVAFEIGAAFAFKKKIIPCAVHISPTQLPWSLSELQAPALDTVDGWEQLAEAIANAISYPSGVDKTPLLELAKHFTAPGDALKVTWIGLTIELRNKSDAPIMNVQATSADTLPQWTAAIQGLSLQPGQSTTLLRSPEPQPHDIEFSWTDVAGATHRRRVVVEGTKQ